MTDEECELYYLLRWAEIERRDSILLLSEICISGNPSQAESVSKVYSFRTAHCLAAQLKADDLFEFLQIMF